MKTTKRLKGMTLMEIVVSMAIYGILALLVVQIMLVVNSTMRATTQLNTRLSYESKFADNQMTTGNTDVVLTSKPKNVTITFNYGAAVPSSISIPMGGNGKIKADEYQADYQSGRDDDMSKDINYHYMVYTNLSPGGGTPGPDPGADWLADGDFHLYVNDGGFPYDIKKVEVGGDDYVSHTATFTGGKLVPTDGHLVDISVSKQNPNDSSNTGYGIVRLVFYRDMTASTGNANVQVQAKDGNMYPSNEFPFLIATLEYTQWFRNPATNTVPEAALYAYVPYTLETDGKITALTSQK